MNNFQPINNGESGSEVRSKLNKLGSEALGPEHNLDASAHGSAFVKTSAQGLAAEQQRTALANINGEQAGAASAAITAHNTNAAAHADFVSRGRQGGVGGDNAFSATQTENLGSNFGMNAYGHNFNATKYIGAQRVYSADRLKAIITKFGGTDTQMPGYFGFSVESEDRAFTSPNKAYIPGIFFFSLNDEANSATYPMKIAVYDGTGARKAYFRNSTTPTLSAWQPIGGGDEETPPLIIQPRGLTNSSTSAEITTAIGSWAALTGAIWDGRTIMINQYAGGQRDIQILICKFLGNIVYIHAFTSDTMTVWVIENYVPDYDVLRCSVNTYSVGAPATTTQAGVVTLASNTGNSTDAGKVFAADANGKLPLTALSETRQTLSLSPGGTLNLSEYPNVDVFIINQTSSSSVVGRIYFPAGQDARTKIKLRMNLTSTATSNPLRVHLHESNGTEVPIQINPSTTKTFYIVGEQFDANSFIITTNIAK